MERDARKSGARPSLWTLERDMTFLRLLGRVEIWAVAAALIAAVLLGIGAWVQALTRSPGIFSPYEGARITFLYAAAIGVPLAVIYGAPVYALLRHKGFASWPAIFAIGVVPGAVVSVLAEHDRQFGIWIAAGGLVTALVTHFVVRHRSPPRSNSAVEMDARQEQPRATHRGR